jgi:1,2-phenylacetyl-CoA epoxidase catalytic subunit
MLTGRNASDIQDAINYALAACPGMFVREIGESAFNGRGCKYFFDRDKRTTRADWMKKAIETANAAGLKIRKTWLVRDAAALAIEIDRQARAGGVDAYRGERFPFCAVA